MIVATSIFVCVRRWVRHSVALPYRTSGANSAHDGDPSLRLPHRRNCWRNDEYNTRRHHHDQSACGIAGVQVGPHLGTVVLKRRRRGIDIALPVDHDLRRTIRAETQPHRRRPSSPVPPHPRSRWNRPAPPVPISASSRRSPEAITHEPHSPRVRRAPGPGPGRPRPGSPARESNFRRALPAPITSPVPRR